MLRSTAPVWRLAIGCSQAVMHGMPTAPSAASVSYLSSSVPAAASAPRRSVVLDPTAFARPTRPLTREEKLNRLQQQQNEEPTSSGAPHNAVSAGEYFSSYVPLESSRSPVPPESSSVAPSEASTREARAFAREDARIRLNKGIKTQLRTGVFSPAPGASPRAAEPAAAQRRLVVPASRALVDAVERGALPSLFGPTAAAEASGAAYRDPYADDDGDDDGFGAGPDRVLSTPAKGGKRQQKKVKTVPRAPVCPAEAAAAAAAAAAASDAAAAAEAEDGALNWFPGHMAKAVQTMAERLRDVQLVIEVRDARCPLSSANPLLDRVAAGRPRVVVLNKADLALGRGAASSAAAGGVRRRAQSLLTRVARRLDTQLDAQRGTGAAGPQRPAPHWQAQLDACGGDAAREAALLRLPDGPAASADEAKRYEAVLTREDSRARARMLRDQRATNPASATVPGADAEARRSSVAASSSVKASARGWCPYEVLLGGRGAVVLTDSLSSVLAPRTILALVQRLAPPRKFSSVPTAVLVCGFPNVGKSTIINSLRRSAIVTGAYSDGYGLSGLGDVYLPASGTGGRAKVGPQPGVTRHVQGFRVSEDPPVVVLDTPGVMTPHLEATALAGPSAPARLALVGCVADKAYDTETVCATLLSELNKQGLHSYARLFKLPDYLPTGDLVTLLSAIARGQRWHDGNIRSWHATYSLSLWGTSVRDDDAAKRFLRARVLYARDRLRHGAGGGWSLRLPRLPGALPLSAIPSGDAPAAVAAASAAGASVRDSDVDWERVDPHLLPLTREEMMWELSPDMERRAQALFLKRYREGALGLLNLDDDVL